MMRACKQVRLSGTIRVPLPPAETFNLFTPTGERAWVVVRREPGEVIEYARVTPGDRAGLVRVVCSAEENDITAATVTYELTALTPDANAALDEFAQQYPEFLEHWHRAIEHAMGRGEG